MRSISLCLAATALALCAAQARGATIPFTCTLGYSVSTSGSGQLYDTARDRKCTAEVVFKQPGGSGTTSRDYSCVVAANTASCTYQIDPGASGVPTGWQPFTVVTAPLYSSTEETNGCTYQIASGENTTSPGLYPTATIFTSPLEIVVLHYFDCTSQP